MMMGIDPGLDGGLAAIGADGAVTLLRMPTLRIGRKREYDLAAIRTWIVEQAPSHVWIEAQGARPGQGVVSMYRTGWGAGLLVGLVAGLSRPYSLVWPARWRAVMLAGMPPGKDSSILRVQQLFPAMSFRKTEHGPAEALLIAEYGRRAGTKPDLIS